MTESVSDKVRLLVREAMQDAWNTICSDTGFHPLDIKQKFEGKSGHLGFVPGHWANLTALLIERRVADDISYADLRASGGIFPDVSTKPF